MSCLYRSFYPCLGRVFTFPGGHLSGSHEPDSGRRVLHLRCVSLAGTAQQTDGYHWTASDRALFKVEGVYFTMRETSFTMRETSFTKKIIPSSAAKRLLRTRARFSLSLLSTYHLTLCTSQSGWSSATHPCHQHGGGLLHQVSSAAVCTSSSPAPDCPDPWLHVSLFSLHSKADKPCATIEDLVKEKQGEKIKSKYVYGYCGNRRLLDSARGFMFLGRAHVSATFTLHRLQGEGTKETVLLKEPLPCKKTCGMTMVERVLCVRNPLLS